MLLREGLDVEEGGLDLDRDGLLKIIRGADAIIPDLTVKVDGELLDAAGEQLKVVANFAVGYDNIDVNQCSKRGVVVTNTPDVLTDATAELALALALAAARGISGADRFLRDGLWKGWQPTQHLGLELSGATIGVLGLGRIGSRFAAMARAITPSLLYTSRSEKPELEKRLGLVRVEFEELLARSDLVSLHAPLTSETHHIIDTQALAQMREGAVLVNTARGELVDTDALVAALKRGKLRAAGLDVFEGEPQVPRCLIELENVVLTPHIGSATERTRNAMAELAARNVIVVLASEAPLTPVLK